MKNDCARGWKKFARSWTIDAQPRAAPVGQKSLDQRHERSSVGARSSSAAPVEQNPSVSFARSLALIVNWATHWPASCSMEWTVLFDGDGEDGRAPT